MPNINAALGLAQLEQLPALISAKRRLFNKYAQAFNGIDGVCLFSEPEGSLSNYWLQTLLLNKESSHQRDAVLGATNDAGFMTRPCWNLIPTLAPFRNNPSSPIPVAEELASRIVNLPSSAFLS
jgi:dTDP-4-amino-4,6-dideoxygalactose transaminase